MPFQFELSNEAHPHTENDNRGQFFKGDQNDQCSRTRPLL